MSAKSHKLITLTGIDWRIIYRLNRSAAESIARLPVPLETKLQAAFFAVSMLLILLGAIGLGALGGLDAHIKEIIESDREVASYYRLRHDVDVLMVSLTLSMWLPGAEYLDRANGDIKDLQDALNKLPPASTSSVSEMSEMRQQSDRLVGVLDQVLILCRQGNVDHAGVLLLEQGHPLEIKLKELSDRLVADVESRQKTRIGDARKAYRHAQDAVVIFALGGILLGWYLGHTISGFIVRPLRQIGARLSRIATGEFSQSISVPNRDELGALADDINQTSRHLSDLYTALETEKERSEDLLLQILPRPIVSRLRSGETPIADYIPEATILFADIAGFTALSSTMLAVEIVEMLDLLFSRFDALAQRFGLEKIKTIGDGYMVAGGVPSRSDDHAVAVVEMALAMQAATVVATRALGVLGQPLTVRIGIHSGPLVSGVLGTSKPVFDVWGDTVNVASRMEKYGEPGRIHVSAATRDLLSTRYHFECRGQIEVKGKGVMETYFLERPDGLHVVPCIDHLPALVAAK